VTQAPNRGRHPQGCRPRRHFWSFRDNSAPCEKRPHACHEKGEKGVSHLIWRNWAARYFYIAHIWWLTPFSFLYCPYLVADTFFFVTPFSAPPSASLRIRLVGWPWPALEILIHAI